MVDGRPLCNVLRPHLLTRALLERQANAANLVVAAAGRALRGADRRRATAATAPWRVCRLDRRCDLYGCAARSGRAPSSGSTRRSRVRGCTSWRSTPTRRWARATTTRSRTSSASWTYSGAYSETYDARPLLMEPAMLDTGARRCGGAGAEPGSRRSRSSAASRGRSSSRALSVDIDNYRRHGLEAELCDAEELSFDGRATTVAERAGRRGPPDRSDRGLSRRARGVRAAVRGRARRRRVHAQPIPL